MIDSNEGIYGFTIPIWEPNSDEKLTNVHIVAPGKEIEFMKPVKAKEFIDVNHEMFLEFMKTIHCTRECFSGDIFVAGNFPTPDIEIRFNEILPVVGRVTPYSKETIYDSITRIRAESTSEEELSHRQFVCGEVQIQIDLDPARGPITVCSPIMLSAKSLTLNWMDPFFQLPKFYSSRFQKNGNVEDLSRVFAAIFEAYIQTIISWISIQTMLLNPVIAYRCKRETIPDPNVKSNKSKKGPKKYVKRLTIGDLSDLEFNKSKHQIKEPFWWVSGHWREYKSGKKIFIEGYWKGPFREYGIVNAEPREREMVFESDMDKFAKVLNEKIKSGDI